MSQGKHFKGRLPKLTVALVSVLAAWPAHAFEIDTGNEDLAIRWDNTVKLNYGYRLEGQNPDITRTYNYNDGDLNFNKHSATSERIDLLSEFELNYKKEMGFRVSGAAWYDAAYRNLDNANPSTNHVENDKPTVGLSNYTKRYYHGPSGELLDAFVFRNFDFGEQSLNVKAGKTTQYWGESLLTPIHGVNYGQSALDMGKAFSVPGTEAKELFLPRNQIAFNLVTSPTFSFGAQYFLDWQHTRFPEAGSYMGMYDIALDGGETLITGQNPFAPGSFFRMNHSEDKTPSKSGNFGLQSKWSPDWLDGTLGFYARRTDDTIPDTLLVKPDVLPLSSTLTAGACNALGGVGAPGGAPVCVTDPGKVGSAMTNLSKGVVGSYRAAYARDIDIFGLSLSKNIAGVSVGGELNYRRNMPLASLPTITVLPAAFAALTPGAITEPQGSDTGGAYGKTMHGVLNGLFSFNKTPLFDSATLLAELTWNRVLSVTKGYNVYRGNPSYTGIDKATRDFFGMAINFTPTWYQVRPGVDLSMPLSYSVGLKGQSGVPLGGNEHAGSYSVGLSALVNNKYTIDLKYADFFGRYVTDASGQITSSAGLGTLLKDRGTLSLTFKTTF